ncbi:hypothetical protein ACFY3U_16665 [Micromonospora sp. NPDC000089]|uniref:hypothetical protein n=1 Tax=unclassified Micromonospora TaxID=2617518 RepID=UPI0036B5D865
MNGATSDNRTDGPERPMAVTPDDLERALRETLSRRVAVPPPPAADPAGAAVRRARRTRRRRALAGLALAGVATVGVTAGMAQLSGQSGRTGAPVVVIGDPDEDTTASAWPVAPAPPARPEEDTADLLVDGALVAGGQRYELGVGPVERAQRLRDGGGWLLVGAPTPAGRSLWLVPTGGTPRALLAGAEEIALAPDGRQVAWRDDGRLFAAGLIGGQLVATVKVTAPAGVAPVRFVGDRVLVTAGAGRTGFALWRPGPGAAPGAGHAEVLAVYGVRPDGRAVGLVRVAGGQGCLALLSTDLTPVTTRCGPRLAADGRGEVSVDGRWLLANGRIGGADGAVLVDLAPATPTAWAAGPTITGDVAWNGGQVATWVDRSGAVARLRADRVPVGERASSTLVAGAGRPVVVAFAS